MSDLENEEVNRQLCAVAVDELFEACFKRRASHVPNALKTIDNQLKCLIIYCF
jgi:hypothetical protein